MKHLVMAAMVPVASLVVGCGETSDNPLPAVASPQVSAQPASPRAYVLPANFCDVVDWSPFTELFAGGC